MSYYTQRRFKPVSPKKIADAIAGRVGEHRVLKFDDGSLKYLDTPENKRRGHGLYLDSGWYKMLLFVQFAVNGHVFTRRCVNEQIGNVGVLWVRVGGTTYQLSEA